MSESPEQLPMHQLEKAPKEQGHLLEERLSVVFDKFREQREKLEGLKLRPRASLLAGGDKIEDQQIDIIDATDEGWIELNFKLTLGQWRIVLDKIKELAVNGGASKGNIRYHSKDAETTVYDLCEAFEIHLDGMTVRTATGINVRPQVVDLSYNDVQSALGLVQVEIPRNGEELSPKEVALKINKLFALFEISDGLKPPDSVAERKNKWGRYAWHHKLTEQPNAWSAIEDKLEREEVSPGYFTFVERGKHKEYETISPYAVFHSFDKESLPDIIRSGGLFSTHEKYRRGLIYNGTSSIADFETGSAENVFTHMVTEAGCRTLENDSKKAPYQKDLKIPPLSSYMVFEPDLLDRTDWYAFSFDVYGGSRPNSMAWRQSPREALQDPAEKGFHRSNEQMFRVGIPVRKIRAIACRRDLSWQNEVREWFSHYEIEKIGEKDVEFILQEGAEVARKAFSEAKSDGRIGNLPPPSRSWLTAEMMEERLRGDSRDRVLAVLRQAGITEINGKSIEEFVVYAENFYDLIDIAHGAEPRSGLEKQEREAP